jgi:integration host factor subunit beta
MNKSDLIEKMVELGKLPRKQAEEVINLVFDEMTAALTRDERIEIRGFGSFVTKHYRSRTGRNPRTGVCIPVPAKRLPIFKVGKELRERVDYPGNPEAPDDADEADTVTDD